MVDSLALTFDPHSEKIETEFDTLVLTNFSQPIDLTIYLPSVESSLILTARISCSSTDPSRIVVEFPSFCITLQFEHLSFFQEFLGQCLSRFIDLIVAYSLGNVSEDLLWVEERDEKSVWIGGLVNQPHIASGMIVVRNRIVDLGLDYYIDPSSDKHAHAKKLFKFLRDAGMGLGLPERFPVVSKPKMADAKTNSHLCVKIHPSEIWFLAFPLEHFCQYNLGGFTSYRNVEWILSKKSFSRNAFERTLIHNELQNVKEFFKHSLILVNTYSHFHSDPKQSALTTRGIRLLSQILKLLQDVEFFIGEDLQTLSIRWFLNPPKEKVEEILHDQEVYYLFADFHTEEGKWVVEGPEQAGIQNSIPLSCLQNGALEHFRLMRVFHCHSARDPYDTISTPSIINQLLEAGAIRVEGSIMKERFVDYVCSLLFTMNHQYGLRPILKAKCIEKSMNFNTLETEIKSFLTECDWKISQNEN